MCVHIFKGVASRDSTGVQVLNSAKIWLYGSKPRYSYSEHPRSIFLKMAFSSKKLLIWFGPTPIFMLVNEWLMVVDVVHCPQVEESPMEEVSPQDVVPGSVQDTVSACFTIYCSSSMVSLSSLGEMARNIFQSQTVYY